MFEIKTDGSSRLVFLIWKWAFKVPKIHNYNYSYGRLYSFCIGIKNNILEYEFSKLQNPYLCPVIFHIRGLLNVMPRLKVLTDQEYSALIITDDLVIHIVEHKSTSWGWLYNKPVAIDYGD